MSRGECVAHAHGIDPVSPTLAVNGKQERNGQLNKGARVQ